MEKENNKEDIKVDTKKEETLETKNLAGEVKEEEVAVKEEAKKEEKEEVAVKEAAKKESKEEIAIEEAKEEIIIDDKEEKKEIENKNKNKSKKEAKEKKKCTGAFAFFKATIIDTVFILGISVAALFLFDLILRYTAGLFVADLVGMLLIFVLVTSILYTGIMHCKKGATFGQKFSKLKVEKLDK